MADENVMARLVFRTIKEGDKVCCGVRDNGKPLLHRFASERNSHGHDPGYVYLAYLPNGPGKGHYHIGKVEYTRVGTDDFDLDEIGPDLLGALKKRFKNYHPARKGSDVMYDGAKFVHAIRVACGEGAEKQPHAFFDMLGRRFNKGSESFELTEVDVEIFKSATGDVLDRPIKHLTAKEFARYLADQGLSDEAIREWVLLPDGH